MKKLDIVEIGLVTCLVIVTIGCVFGKTSMEDVLALMAAIGLKVAPSSQG